MRMRRYPGGNYRLTDRKIGGVWIIRNAQFIMHNWEMLDIDSNWQLCITHFELSAKSPFAGQSGPPAGRGRAPVFRISHYINFEIQDEEERERPCNNGLFSFEKTWQKRSKSRVILCRTFWRKPTTKRVPICRSMKMNYPKYRSGDYSE